ncbi:MAG: ATP synthase F0 subunit C [Lachnospiraceae bacterium]|nr:ATP synthase F0 subunit C [Lachnospiraceae bacterium]
MTVYAAQESTETVAAAQDGAVSGKALGAGIALGLAALGGTIGMGMAVAKSNESVARQPEELGNIRTLMMLGLVFIETVVIYALIVAILIIFVL